jgi:hypothetical protein
MSGREIIGRFIATYYVKVAMDNIIGVEIPQAVGHLFDLGKDSRMRTGPLIRSVFNSQISVCQRRHAGQNIASLSHVHKVVRPKPPYYQG